MTQTQKFCGECGAPLKSGALFCGACGAPVRVPDSPTAPETDIPRQAEPPAQPPAASTNETGAKSPPVPTAPEVPPRTGARPSQPAADVPPTELSQAASFSEMISSGVLWGVVWLAGWAPLGAFMGFFWTEVRQRYAEFYDRYGYAPGWGYSFPGAVTGFALAGLVGGLVAGVVLRRAVPQAPSGGRPLTVALLWIAGWLVALGLPASEFLSGGRASDDILLFLAFAAAPLIAIVSAQIALPRRDPSLSTKRRVLVSLGWAGAAVIAIIFTIVFIDL